MEYEDSGRTKNNQVKSAKKTRDMTTGTIWKHIVMFAIPLLIGNFFQQFYNAVDSVVVGNYVSKQALAAVGSTGPVINTLVGFFMGLSTGAGVVISHYFGGKNEKGLHQAIHTTFLMTFILCVVMTIVGISMVPFMVRFMKTPQDVLKESTEYLRIYFAGISGLMIYNMGSGILRAVGDSKRPLYFLCMSSVINIVLDLVFVLGLHRGIEGVAWATILSQFCLHGSGGSDQNKRKLSADLEGSASVRTYCEKNMCDRYTCRTADGSYIIFQCICAVIYQSFWFCLYGGLDLVYESGSVCYPADAEYFSGSYDFCWSECGCKPDGTGSSGKKNGSAGCYFCYPDFDGNTFCGGYSDYPAIYPGSGSAGVWTCVPEVYGSILCLLLLQPDYSRYSAGIRGCQWPYADYAQQFCGLPTDLSGSQYLAGRQHLCGGIRLSGRMDCLQSGDWFLLSKKIWL